MKSYLKFNMAKIQQSKNGLASRNACLQHVLHQPLNHRSRAVRNKKMIRRSVQSLCKKLSFGAIAHNFTTTLAKNSEVKVLIKVIDEVQWPTLNFLRLSKQGGLAKHQIVVFQLLQQIKDRGVRKTSFVSNLSSCNAVTFNLRNDLAQGSTFQIESEEWICQLFCVTANSTAPLLIFLKSKNHATLWVWRLDSTVLSQSPPIFFRVWMIHAKQETLLKTQFPLSRNHFHVIFHPHETRDVFKLGNSQGNEGLSS